MRKSYTIAQRIKCLKGEHYTIDTVDADKNVRINSRTITTDASIVGMQCKPRAGVDMTNDLTAIEVEPAVNEGFATTGSIIGIKSQVRKRGTGAKNVGGEMRAFQGELETPSTYAGTVTGPASVLRCRNAMHGTVTNGVFVLHVPSHEGNKAWDGLAYLPDDGQIASDSGAVTLDSYGWIKVKINDTTRYIPVGNL